MIRIEYVGSGEICEVYEPRLTNRRFKLILEWTLENAMANHEHDEVAIVTIGNALYYISADTWQEFARVYGEVNVFKDSLETAPLYTKYYTLAD